MAETRINGNLKSGKGHRKGSNQGHIEYQKNTTRHETYTKIHRLPP